MKTLGMLLDEGEGAPRCVHHDHRTARYIREVEKTLPYSWYSDPEILRREQERIFRPAWQYVGHLGELPEPGTYFATQRRPHARRRHARARRRAARASSTSAATAASRSPRARASARRSSARTTRGRTGSTARSARAALARRSRTSRRTSSASCRVAVDTWGPFLFVNAGRDPEPLAEALGSMPAQVAELGLDVDALVFYTRWEAEIDANWKIVCENFLECYHCQVAHPAARERCSTSRPRRTRSRPTAASRASAARRARRRDAHAPRR